VNEPLTDPAAAGAVSPLRTFWVRHRTLLWSLHSAWALFTGAGVVWLARERYGFAPWVLLFLAIIWASTLFTGRKVAREERATGAGAVPAAHTEAISYVTRILYQETLFFLLPFYAYSTVVGSVNMVFPVLLGGLALISCLDVVFDGLLRRRPAFALTFFGTVAFAALNLVLPLLWSLGPNESTTAAAALAVATAWPTAKSPAVGRARWFKALAAAGLLAVALLLPSIVPPVPLRLERATFSTDFDRETLTPLQLVTPGSGKVAGAPVLFAVLEIFAPSNVPASVSIEWYLDGELVRESRDIEITAHEAGFRIWDAWRPDPGPIPRGRIEVRAMTSRGRAFGRATVVAG